MASLGYVQFVSFWGAGFKAKVGASDRRAVAHAVHLCATIGARLEAPTRLTLLLTDTHARLNEIPRECAEAYMASMSALAAAFRVDTMRLSELPGYDRIEQRDVGLPDDAVKGMSRYTRAAHRFGLGQEGAIRYLRLRRSERKLVSQQFPDAILLSGDRPSDKFLLPELPTVFFYTGGPGNNHKPWLEAEARCAE